MGVNIFLSNSSLKGWLFGKGLAKAPSPVANKGGAVMTDLERLIEELRYEMAKRYIGMEENIHKLTKLKNYFYTTYGFDLLIKTWNEILLEIAEFQKEEEHEPTAEGK